MRNPRAEEMKLPEPSRWGTFCAMEQQACDLLVTASRMLGGAEQSVAPGDVAVAVRDGKILETGSAAELEARWMPAVRRDLGNVLLMPGLINAHTHVPMTFLRGFADDLPLMEWLTGHIFPVEARLTDKIVSLGARLGMYEMMRTGTTAFVDSYLLEANVLQEAERMWAERLFLPFPLRRTAGGTVRKPCTGSRRSAFPAAAGYRWP